MPSQIIDNRRKRLVDEINVQLDATVKAKIAGGASGIVGSEGSDTL